MKNQRPKDTNSWKLAGAAMATACFLFNPFLSQQAQASTDTTPQYYLGNELGALGDSSVATATQADVKSALIAILGQTANSTVATPQSNPGLFLTYILANRTDALSFSADLVKAAIQGLMAATPASGNSPLTEANIVSIVDAAARATASSAAVGATDALKAAAVAVQFGKLAKNAQTTAMAVDATPAAMAGALFSDLAAVTYGASSATLPAANLATLAGGIITNAAVSQQSAAGDSVATAYLNATFASTSGTARNAVVKALLAASPATAASSIATEVLAQTGQTYTTGTADAEGLFLQSIAAAADIPKGAALAAKLFAVTGSNQFLGMVADITTGTNVLAVRSAVLSSLTAGMAVNNPSDTVTYLTKALTAESQAAKASNNAAFGNMQDMITGVTTALAGANTPDSAAAIQSAIGYFVNQSNLWINSFNTAARPKLAIALVKAVATTVPADMSGAAASSVTSVINAVAPLAATNDAGGLTTLGAALLALPSSSAVNYSSVVQTMVQTMVNGSNWSNSGGATGLATTLGINSTLAVAVKAQVAAGLAIADPTDAVANTKAIANQNTGAACLKNVAAVGSAVLSTAVGGSNASVIVKNLIDQIDSNPSVKAGTDATADRSALATALIAKGTTPSTAVLNAVAQAGTYAVGAAAGTGVTDSVALAMAVTKAMISASPLSNPVVDAAVSDLMPSALADQVRFANAAIAVSSKASAEAAFEVGVLAQAAGTPFSTFVTTVPSVAGKNLAVNGFVANLAAGYVHASGANATAATLGPLLSSIVTTANAGSVVASMIVGNTIPLEAPALSASAAAIVTGSKGLAGKVVGTILAPVLSAVYTSGTAVVEQMVDNVLPDLATFKVATPYLPTRPVSVSGTDPAHKTYNTDLIALNKQNLARVAELGTLVGTAAGTVADQATLDALISTATAGTVSVMTVTGSSQTIDLGGLLSSATPVAQTSGSSASNSYTPASAMMSFGNAAITAIPTGKSAAFTQAFLTEETGLFNLSSVAAVSTVVSGIINNGLTAKAGEVVQGAAAFALTGANTMASLASSLATGIIVKGKASAAAGLVTYSLSHGGTGTDVHDITGSFAQSVVTAGGAGIDANIIAVAKAVATASPVNGWEAAAGAAACITATSGGANQLAVLCKTVEGVVKSVAGPTAYERLGLVAAAVAAGSGVTDAQVVATIIAAAVAVQPKAAYDIFGSVMSAVPSVTPQSVYNQMSWAYTQINFSPSNGPTAYNTQYNRAINDMANSTGHFYTGASGGDLTGTETAVTNM